MSRISSGTMTVAIFALLMGLAGAYTVRQYLKVEPVAKAEPAPPAPQLIPFASLDLVTGKTISLGDITVIPMTPAQITKRKLPEDTVAAAGNVIGRALRVPLKKGEPFRTTDFYPEGMGPSVTERLKPGFRAVTISVGDMGTVAGFAGPGSTVDVLFRSRARSKFAETTMTLVEKVEVLALGQAVVPGTRGGDRGKAMTNMVTLAVSPLQASALKVVDGQGDLSLAIRHPEDDNKTASNSRSKITLDQLLGLNYTPPQIMEIYHGGSRHTITFDQQMVVDEQFGGVTGGMPVPAVSSTKRSPAGAGNAQQGAATSAVATAGASREP